MAGKWQLWYPHHIDAWQGSATIQIFTDAAYRGFHNLIMEQFQAPDGMLPDDDIQLARMSRLGARWEAVKGDVRAALTSNGAGRIYSNTQYLLWQSATARHATHLATMEELNKRRAEKREAKAKASDDRNDDRNGSRNDDRNEIGNRKKEIGNKKKAKTCAVDNRAAEFRGMFQDAFQVANGVPAPWDGKEATNLARFLKASPTITVEQWKHILYHRSISPINQKANLSTWVGRALSWLDAPADEWGKPLKTAPARAALPSQPVAHAMPMTEREQYDKWQSMSNEFKRQNPWVGSIPPKASE